VNSPTSSSQQSTLLICVNLCWFLKMLLLLLSSCLSNCVLNFVFTEQPTFTDDQSSHESLGPAIGSALQLECPVRGNPSPVITWLMNGQVIREDSNHVIRQNGELFLIRSVQDSDAANYECEADNGVGEVLRRTFTVGWFASLFAFRNHFSIVLVCLFCSLLFHVYAVYSRIRLTIGSKVKVYL